MKNKRKDKLNKAINNLTKQLIEQWIIQAKTKVESQISKSK